MKYILEHWKTSLAGVIVALFTILLMAKQITVEEWITGIGGINTVILLVSKDPDKRAGGTV